MKTFSILLIFLLLTSVVLGTCYIAAKCNKDNCQVSIMCDGFSYNVCSSDIILQEDGAILNRVICCNEDTNKCITILVPTDKVGM